MSDLVFTPVEKINSKNVFVRKVTEKHMINKYNLTSFNFNFVKTQFSFVQFQRQLCSALFSFSFAQLQLQLCSASALFSFVQLQLC